ncbi:MAG: Major facilitator family transporter [Rickettsiaceae bacterium]|jgi:predicted MFS family arabinose efflux permease|nr:Major facilitator family transporter [Rickettsiaceae bacterium]
MFITFANQRKPLILWGVVTLFFAFQFILRLTVGILREDIMSKYHIDTIAFGSLAGFYYLGYAGMQIPFGIMLDRFNFRSIVILAIMVTVIGTLPFIYAENWYYVLIGRFLIGAGSAVSFLAVTKVIKLFFRESQHPMMIGLSFTFGLMGAVFGGKPMKLIFDNFGYEQGFSLLIIISILVASIIYAVKDAAITRVDEQTNINTPTIKDVFALLFNPTILLIGISGGLMVGALEGFADVWSIAFFNEIYGIEIKDSIFANSFIYIGMCFGGPILVYVAESLKSDNKVILLTNILTILVFGLLFMFRSWNYYLLCALMIFLGVLCCYQVIVFTKVSGLVDKKVTGLAIAVTNCINMSFGSLFHTIISYLMQSGTLIEMEGEALRYGYSTFIISLSVIPFACFIGQIGFLAVGYTYRSKKLAQA